jgi:hypothetical protein
MENIFFANIIAADFKENEILIEPENENFSIKFCKVAIIKIDNIQEQMELEEFINNLKK